MAVLSLLLLLATPVSARLNCEGLELASDPERCAWEQEVKTCMGTSCHGYSGEAYQICRRDTGKIRDCCQKHYQNGTAPPDMCNTAAMVEGVKACVHTECKGCSGEACQLCQEDSAHIATCCAQHNVSNPSLICRCAGLQGDALKTCQWDQEATVCLERKCGCAHASTGWIIGDVSFTCDLCEISFWVPCCQETEQEAPQPYLCKNAFQQAIDDVVRCVKGRCRDCGPGCSEFTPCDGTERYEQCCKESIFMSQSNFNTTKICKAAQAQGSREHREILP
ncbi:unnamed protein product [Symbiodinium pilosum]|uniref:Uncharacterized protein n=1 Tax=Symbiodinium pilosum TaxID=2952 RepID=A0A812MZB0_SYMPI|nr:unnamed protein product [Symbiodinium pilosum]